MSKVYFHLLSDRFMRSACLQTPRHFTRFVSKSVAERDIDYSLHNAAVEGAKPKRSRPITMTIGKKRTAADANFEDSNSGKRRRIGSARSTNHVDPRTVDSTPKDNFKERLVHGVKSEKANLQKGSTEITTLPSKTLATMAKESDGGPTENTTALSDNPKDDATKHPEREIGSQKTVITSNNNAQAGTEDVLEQADLKAETIAIPEQILGTSNLELESSLQPGKADYTYLEESSADNEGHSGYFEIGSQETVITSNNNEQVGTEVVLEQADPKAETTAIPEQSIKSSNLEPDSSLESIKADHACPEKSSAENDGDLGNFEGDSGYFEGVSESDDLLQISQSQSDHTSECGGTKEKVSVPSMEIAQSYESLDSPVVNDPQEQNEGESCAEDLNAGDRSAVSTEVSHEPIVISSDPNEALSHAIVSIGDTYADILEAQFKVEDVTEWIKTLVSKSAKRSGPAATDIKKPRIQSWKAPAIYIGKKKREDEFEELDGRGVYVENKKRFCYGIEERQMAGHPAPSAINSGSVTALSSVPTASSLEIEMVYDDPAPLTYNAFEAILDDAVNMDVQMEDGSVQDDVAPIYRAVQMPNDDPQSVDTDMMEDDPFRVQDSSDDTQEMTDISPEISNEPMADCPVSQHEETTYSHPALTYSAEAQMHAALQSYAQNKLLNMHTMETDSPYATLPLEHTINPIPASGFAKAVFFDEGFPSYGPMTAPHHSVQRGYSGEENMGAPYPDCETSCTGESGLQASLGVERIAPPSSPAVADPSGMARFRTRDEPSAITKHKHGRTGVSSAKRTTQSGSIQKRAPKSHLNLNDPRFAKRNPDGTMYSEHRKDALMKFKFNQDRVAAEQTEYHEMAKEVCGNLDTTTANASSASIAAREDSMTVGLQAESVASYKASNFAGPSLTALPLPSQVSITSPEHLGSPDSVEAVAAPTQSESRKSSSDATAEANASPMLQPCDAVMQTLQRTNFKAETQAVSVAVPAPAQSSAISSPSKTKSKQPESSVKSLNGRSNKKAAASRSERKTLHSQSSTVEKSTKLKLYPAAFLSPFVIRTVGRVPGPAVAAATVSSTSAQIAPGPQRTPSEASNADDGFISLDSTDADDLAGALRFGSSMNNDTDAICDLQGISNCNRSPRHGEQSGGDRLEEEDRRDGGNGASPTVKIAPVSEDLEIAEKADDEGSGSDDSDEDEPGEERIIEIALDRVVLSKKMMVQAKAWAQETRTDPVEWESQINKLGISIGHPVELAIKLKAYQFQCWKRAEEMRDEYDMAFLSQTMHHLADLSRPPTDLDGRDPKALEVEERSTSSRPVEPAARKMDIDENYDIESGDENQAIDTSRNART